MAEEKHKTDSEGSVEENISSDYVSKQKLGNLPKQAGLDPQLVKEMQEIQKDADKYKKEIIKKFKFVEAVGIVPAQASQKVEEEYEVPKEETEKNLIHVLTIIPESHFKEIGKVRFEAIKIARGVNEKLWVHIMTPVDVWNLCLDSKFDIAEAFAMCSPVLDKGILGALRVAQIHKSLVLRKFEKYVTSYIVAGSMVTGTAHKDSDIDTAIIIDDTDVKRMPRLELKEKLRGIIYSYIQEATAIAGVKNILNVQVWLLTEFWDGVKDAVPVFFTFIRDGAPLYDRGTFLPWKSLLKMGKIKPSPEAIDMFMKSGDKLEKSIERRLMDIAVIDIYWGVLTPTQGLLMLYGSSTPTPKETIKTVKEVFYEKEKLLEKKYIDILEKIIAFYKGYEHGKNKKISGEELDKMSRDALDYIERLKQLRKQLEKRIQEKSIDEIYEDVFGMLGSLLKQKAEKGIIKDFEEKLVNEGKFPKRYLEGLQFIAKVKKDFDKKEKAGAKTKKQKVGDKELSKERRDVDKARKISHEIVNALVEYTQRCDFMSMQRAQFLLKGEKTAEVFFLENVFVVEANKISKFVSGRLQASNAKELKKQLLEHQDKETKIDFKVLEKLKKLFGDF